MLIERDLTIGEIVDENFKTAEIFNEFDIDFCCGGNRSLENVCENQGINIEYLMASLQKIVDEKHEESEEWSLMNLSKLTEYIESKHHKYIEQTGAKLKVLLEKIAKVHGSKHPELIELKKLFFESLGDLTIHIKKEELIVFPYIRKMDKMDQEDDHGAAKILGNLQNPIQTMMKDHDHEGRRFQQISLLTNKYLVPDDACMSYRMAYGLLSDFEKDLHQHIHLENNVLFPKALELEADLLSRS